MKQYHKIQTIYKREMKNNGKIIEGEYSLPEFEYLKDNEWVWTEKIDGTNIRIMWNGENVVFGGKSDNAQIPVFLLYKLQELFEGTEKKKLFKETFLDERDGEPMTEVCLYGEGFGAKIQKGGGNYIKDGVDFILFDVKIGNWWLKRADVQDIASKLGLKIVRIVGYGTLDGAIDQVKGGFDSEFGNFTAEGLVLTPLGDFKTRNGDRIITKIKCKDFK